MRIIVASDHAGFPLKQAVVDHLTSLKVTITDAGPDTHDVSVDYPDCAQRVGRAGIRSRVLGQRRGQLSYRTVSDGGRW